MRETYPCWSGFICTAWPVTRGEMALQAGVQLSPTEHWPRQRDARRLGLKTAQHFADGQGVVLEHVACEGPLCFWWTRTWLLRGPSKRCDCLRVHTQIVGRHPGPVSAKSSADVGTLHGRKCAWPRIAGFDGMVENKKLRARSGGFSIQESPTEPFSR